MGRVESQTRVLGPWGKTDGYVGDFHHLVHHCADVAAVFEALLSHSIIRLRLEKIAGRTLSSTLCSRLSVLCFLHDAGKLHPGFQAKGWQKGLWRGPLCGHLQAGAAIFLDHQLKAIAEPLCKRDLISWGVREADTLLAVLAHHGRPFEPDDSGARNWRTVDLPCGTYDPKNAAVEMGAAMREWFPAAFRADLEKIPTNPEFLHLFSGVVALADWIGSDRRFFPFVERFDTDYIESAKKRANDAIQAIGLKTRELQSGARSRQEFSQATGYQSPNPHQKTIGAFPAEEQLVILEAETGSGKTEAAMWRFVRLMAEGRVDSLYFALPTRSAAIQLHSRINRMLKHCWGESVPEAILSVPGYLRAGEVEGTALPDWKVRWDDDERADEMVLASRWAAENSKRYLAATVAVGTVDQAMLAALQVKHAHLRSAAISRSFLVIDEVHASDAYMTEVQSWLLRTHLERGGYAMLMSATLGSRARVKWLGQPLPTYREAIETPYPAVWGIRHGLSKPIVTSRTEKPVSVRAIPSMDAGGAAKIAIEAARRGGRVLVIRNTVKMAIETWQAVQDTGGNDLLLCANGRASLHHGRFAPEDRRLLDGAVEAALSPGSQRVCGLIVVGTQTLEQSLDIDADLLITDLCPMDVLLQRIGRLHRHPCCQRATGFEEAACYVLLPSNGLEPLLKPSFENGLGATKVKGTWAGIYCDLSILELTRRFIVDQPVWRLPAMNRLLVESATHEARIQELHRELGEKWIAYYNEVYGREIADRGVARNILLDVQVPFSETRFPTDEERIRTRLGGDGAQVRFTTPIEGPFGTPISSITLPPHWSFDVESTEAVTPEVIDEVVTLRVGMQIFHYDCRGLTRGSA